MISYVKNSKVFVPTTQHMAVLNFVDEISKAFENDMDTIGIFIDLLKAFDTIDRGSL